MTVQHAGLIQRMGIAIAVLSGPIAVWLAAAGCAAMATPARTSRDEPGGRAGTASFAVYALSRGRGVPEVAQSLRDLAEGEGEVRAGVAVRDGEDIQAVQLVPSRGHPVRRREQRATEARAVHVPDAGAPGHGRPAIPSPR